MGPFALDADGFLLCSFFRTIGARIFNNGLEHNGNKYTALIRCSKGGASVMRYRLTVIFSLFALALCTFNFLGLDPDDIFFFMFSVPVWLIELFMDIHYVNVYLVYLLTIVTYGLFGYLGDYFVNQRRSYNRYRG
jgi:hypothetical protein